jgi:hypothetical protein
LPAGVTTRRENGEVREYLCAAPIDVDRDSDLDLVLGGWTTELAGPRDTLLLNDGTGHFVRSPVESMPLRPNFGGAIWVDAADVDGDQWPDLLFSFGEKLALFLNQGNGTFRDASATLPPEALAAGAARCDLVDLNADGARDILCAHRIATIHDPERREIIQPTALFFNRGDGTFETMPPIDDYAFAGWVEVVDANGDGLVDLMGPEPYPWVAYQRKPYRTSPP